MLSAHNEETDRIIALEIGADDYVPKAFSSRELAGAHPGRAAALRSGAGKRAAGKKRTAGISSACATSP